ncbi:MAG TPA: response regulator [Thermoanaerobaculia bacterium]|nr:response regulator [Thermoanaerobaculia bacterium]
MNIERLLLVEDNVVAANAIASALAEHGIEAHLVYCGREAVGKLIHSEAQAAVIDLTLPDIDGVTVAEIIRRNWPEIPIILTSGHTEPAAAWALLKDGRTAFLQKPFDLDVLLTMIHALVRTTGAPNATNTPTPSAPAGHPAR